MPLPTIKAIGFDLDQTLYQETSETRALVRTEISLLIAGTLHIPVPEAREKFEEAYAKFDAGGQALESLGIPQGSERIRDCLTRANLSSVLQYDERLVRMMRRISAGHFTFLLTESRRDDAERKLRALGLDSAMFDYAAYWDTTPERKHTGTIFPQVFEMSKLHPPQHLYCGDKMNDDILPAKKAGLKTVLVGSQHEAADYCLKTIYELEELLYGR